MSNNDTEIVTGQTEGQGDKDLLYYFETVIFKVENTLFRVIKGDFDVEGTVFEAMFTLPPVDDEKVEGATAAHPIVLEGISKIAFQGFLRAIYPSRSTAPWTHAEMIGALHLSTMWGFSDLRKNAIERLSPSIKGNPSYENIMLAKQNKVQEWLLDAYVTLGLVPGSSLDLLELYKKGLDGLTITKLFMAREGIGARDVEGKHVNCPHCRCHYDQTQGQGMSGDVLRRQAVERVNQLFAEELASLEA